MNKNFFKKSILLSTALSVTILGSNPKSFFNLQPDRALISPLSTPAVSAAQLEYSAYLTNIYETARLYASGLDPDVFYKAVTGYYNLKNASKINNEHSLITIVDFNKSSCSKRLWVIDLDAAKLLINTWVAHGQGSGDDMASQFSNDNDSHQSSLGFYLTGEIYNGKHGRSLRLDGMDAGFNSNARMRDIVIHAANYVGQQIISSTGRLGRSFGCPAVAPEVAPTIINLLKDKTVLFINGENSAYQSKYLDQDFAANYLFHAAKLQHSQVAAML